MHCSRNVARSSPSVVRIVRPAGPCGRRNASFFPGPVGFPRFGPPFSAGNDFAPLFRLFDDFTGPSPAHWRQNTFGFQPRFDVREVGESYELRGELPGVEANNLEVEFTDPQTLVVRGRTESEHTAGTPPTAAAETTQPAEAEAAKEAEADNSDAASTYSTGSYQKPSVEDEAVAESSADAQATPATEPSEPAKTEAVTEQKQEQPTSRYWISERSTGTFQRVFKFPSRVDQEAVTASLKNGILNIVVPKAAAPAAKKITVE